MKTHVLAPYSEQAHVFTVEAHQSLREPGLARMDLLDSIQLGGLDALTLVLESGVGARASLPRRLCIRQSSRSLPRRRVVGAF